MIFPDMPDEIDRRFNAGDHRLSQIARESILGGMFFDLQQKASGSVKQINSKSGRSFLSKPLGHMRAAETVEVICCTFKRRTDGHHNWIRW
jgi:hypothetical protein